MARFVALALLLALATPPGGPPALRPIRTAAAVESFDFAAGGGFAIERSGCLIVYDSGANRLLCLDPATGRSRAVGRAGQGPGEFGLVTALVALRGGGAVVYDAGNGRLVRIASDWTAAATIAASPVQQLFEGAADSLFALTVPSREPVDLVSLSWTGGTRSRFRPTDIDSTGAFVDPGLPVGPFVRGMLRLRNGTWLVPAIDDYALFVADARGAKRFRLARPEIVRERPDAQERARIEAQFIENTATLAPDVKRAVRQLYDRRLARLKPAIVGSALAEDRLGRLWVGTTRLRSDSTEVDVFGSDRRFLGTRRIVGAVSALAVAGDTLYAMTERLAGRADGELGILRFRIE